MSLAPVYTTAQIRAIEAAARPEGQTLMERAGLAAAEHALAVMGEHARAVLVVAGPGNNGGDAFEVAARLRAQFYRVDVLFAGDAGRLSADASNALSKWHAAGGTDLDEFPSDAARRYGLLVDGLFGIGLARPLEGRYARLIECINNAAVPVFALDIPSGLNADTGAIMGVGVRAAHTMTFIGWKPGLFTLDGPDCCGKTALGTLSVPAETLREPAGRLLSSEVISSAVAPRRRNFHKGNAGNVAVLGGASGMLGAALLAGRAALKCGAGRVYLGLIDPQTLGVDPQQPELMLRAAENAPLTEAVIAAGPGMGTSLQARTALERALNSDSAIVLDADALNLLAGHAHLADTLRRREAPTLMTPHPAEAARLLGTATEDVQADRVAAARTLAERYRALVALKGNGTIVAEPGNRWWINPTGHPGMASAGMGDALTGMVAALLAQGSGPLEALLAGVWLHGAAGDAVAASAGAVGTSASEVIEKARLLLNRHLREH